MIEIRGLNKYFDGKHVLKDIDIDIKEGDIVGVLGPSGSGKSTFIRCINELEDFDSGEMLFSSPDLKEAIGMVFQNFNLFPHKTVMENICLAPRLAGYDEDETNVFALDILEKMGLSHKKDNYPKELSGGEKQRIAIARALAMKPKLMLFDEPTSALDPGMVWEVLSVMKDLADSGMTMMIVTHEIGFIKEIANRVIYLSNGKLVADSSPEDFFNNQENQEIKEFLDSVI